MKKLYITLLLCGASLMASAQGTFDVLKMSETQLNGTSRYMSMAGAFGALGGDVSAISQNPGGIGVYRKSDISVTMNLNFLSSKTPGGDKLTNTKFWFNNVGYVGSMKIDSDFFKYFNWGFSFNRINSFQRRYQGGYNVNNSLTNKIAQNLTDGNWTEEDLSVDNYSGNIYYDSNAPWLGILAYQSYLLNPNSDGSLQGLATNGTTGSANYYVDEKGHTDEYNITLGGNFKNTVYWGINFGITDLDFDSYQYYGEDLDNAMIYDYRFNDGSTTLGYAGYDFQSYQETRGTGYNFKMGVIVRPINQLRIGAAFHTPTYYDMKDLYKVQSGFDLQVNGDDNMFQGNTETGEEGYYDEYRYTIKTPWRFIGSLAVVPSSKGMISMDYEYVGANTMRCGDEGGYNYADTEQKIKDQLQASHILRVGAEYRATQNLSLRAGYSYQTSPVKDAVKGVSNNNVDVVSSNYMYQYDKSNQYITCGLGYRYKSFYADAAYVHQTRTSQYHAYPGEQGEEVKDNKNKIALTIGFRF
ncbi:MAG: outer membrane protein transport protein [Muribaculaceae bacterium]|nr:outer membrane protein transport protein [Muribaculaceae bacterium]